MSDITELNVQTGELTQRAYTQDELDTIAAGNAADAARQQAEDALNAKRSADIVALGTRAEMQAEAASANSVPALRDLVLKLAEIVYSNEKGTVD